MRFIFAFVAIALCVPSFSVAQDGKNALKMLEGRWRLDHAIFAEKKLPAELDSDVSFAEFQGNSFTRITRGQESSYTKSKSTRKKTEGHRYHHP